MKLPVLHDLKAVKGETISVNIGYSNIVEADSLFACVRKLANDEEYQAKFNIDVSTDDLESDENCKIVLSLNTNDLKGGSYKWDLFLWSGDHPIKCLVKGQVNIIEGISNRGKQ